MQMHKDSQMRTVLLVSIQHLNESSKNWMSRKSFLRSRILSNHTNFEEIANPNSNATLSQANIQCVRYLLDNNTRTICLSLSLSNSSNASQTLLVLITSSDKQ